jgi:hypothetical protein
LAWSRWSAPHGNAPRCSTFPRGPRKYTLAAFSVACVPPGRRAPYGLASHPAVFRPPSKDAGHGTLTGAGGADPDHPRYAGRPAVRHVTQQTGQRRRSSSQ